MEITRVGTQPSKNGPADWFSGTVRIDPLFDRADPARVSGALVTFEPAARTAWHTHPLGQTLIVTSGCGWAQREGGPVEEIRPAVFTMRVCAVSVFSVHFFTKSTTSSRTSCGTHLRFSSPQVLFLKGYAPSGAPP